MPDAVPNPTSAPSDLAWRVIGLTSLYRLLLPPVLLILQSLATPGILAPAEDPVLFRVVCYVYLVLGVLLILARRVPRPSPLRRAQRSPRGRRRQSPRARARTSTRSRGSPVCPRARRG